MAYLTSDFHLPTIFRVALAYDIVSAKDAKFTLMGEFNQMSRTAARSAAAASSRLITLPAPVRCGAARFVHVQPVR